MWRLIFAHGVVRPYEQFSVKPSAFEGEIHPSHKPVDLYLGYFEPINR